MRLLDADTTILDAAAALLTACRAAGLTIATAESCTGGLIAAVLTAIPGSSDVVLGGAVTYTNALKISLLGVPADLISRHGAVSREVAEAMAAGALARTGADIAIAVTGIAGPGGGSPEKPVGLVWLSAQRAGHPPTSTSAVFPGDRTAVRTQTVARALVLLEGKARPGALPLDQAGAKPQTFRTWSSKS